MNDPAVLRKMIAELELENKKLKDQESTSSKSSYNQNYSASTRQPMPT